jgi:hypothetical protein
MRVRNRIETVGIGQFGSVVHAYRLRTNDWDSGRAESEQILLVDFAGPPLTSRQRVVCAVKVWTDNEESAIVTGWRGG